MSLLTRRSLAAAAAVGVGVATITGFGAIPANAGTPTVHVISNAYIAPLQFAVNSRSIFVTDSGKSALFKVGQAAPVAVGPAPNPANQEQSGDTSGVAIQDGTIAYDTTSADHKDTRLNILKHGHTRVVSLSDFERKNNPDKVNHYGATGNVSSACAAEIGKQGFPVSYTGQYDSHPYAVAALGNDSWAVADAGGNDIVKVDGHGRVSLIAVLPVQQLKVTQAVATALGAPDCVGITYGLEPVPTDVEVGPHGRLYVTTLPGGPESPAIPPMGSVWTVGHGWTHRVATGFVTATNLAVTPSGCIYVAELGAGAIATVSHGHPRAFASLPGVAAVEWANGHLYASTAAAVTGGKGPGTIVRFG